MASWTMVGGLVMMVAAGSLASAPGSALAFPRPIVAVDSGGPGSGTTVPVCDPFEGNCWANVGIPTATAVVDCSRPCPFLWSVVQGGARLRIENLDTGQASEADYPGRPSLPPGLWQFSLTSSSWGKGGMTAIAFH